jgi:mRNA interferase MazF
MLIVEAYFPFLEKPEEKKRPVLILTQPIGSYQTVVCGFISSKIPTKLLPSDVLIEDKNLDFKQSGLLFSSVIRLHKLASLQINTNLTGIIGSLPPSVELEIKTKLRQLFNL